ncbi:hypothetical protein N24_2858 [Corynebacterium suranareeae]|uniref:Cardiolipin synthase N-terminal domain-containing protein n=1 Tax=Corynebacterium suranareeae TaxID=2506452 RepID=A0A161JPF2_9CORY|nr:hypothetical protein [Corynebacterium suranareeae]BAU97120.1 hypothetical protein N24_2858 [Corynebacterium suranareeae]
MAALPLEAGNNILTPPLYDIVWSLFPLIFLIASITIAVVEYKKNKDWVTALGWGALTLFVPFIGFVVWAVTSLVLRSIRNAQAASLPHPTTLADTPDYQR